LKKLHNKPNPQRNTHPDLRTLKSIKTKLNSNEAMIASGDKGNSLVLLPTQQYEAKIKDFIENNNFQSSNTNPTKIFQGQVRKTIKHSPTLIPPNS
jgi:hypothetical protein